MKIIRANLQHLDLLTPLFDAYRVFYGKDSDLLAARAFLQERISLNESIIFLAITSQDNQEIGLGFVQLYPSFSSVSICRTYILNDLYVAPTFRKNGLAKQLMEAAKQQAQSINAPWLMLQTATDNHQAQALYESLGYQQDQSSRYYYLSLNT